MDRASYMREWRAKNKSRSNEYMKKYISKRALIYDELLEMRSCNRCGFSDKRALEFHHLDPTKKRWTISYGVRRFPMEEVRKEIEKCEVVCANCHRIEHFPR